LCASRLSTPIEPKKRRAPTGVSPMSPKIGRPFSGRTRTLTGAAVDRKLTSEDQRFVDAVMLNPTSLLADALGRNLADTYRRIYGDQEPHIAHGLDEAAKLVIERIASSDALYHDCEHTVLVTLCVQDILRGRRLEQTLTPSDWGHTILAALNHDWICPRYLRRLYRRAFRDRRRRQLHDRSKNGGRGLFMPDARREPSARDQEPARLARAGLRFGMRGTIQRWVAA